MIGTAIRIAIAITGDFISSTIINPLLRIADDGVDRITDDAQKRIID